MNIKLRKDKAIKIKFCFRELRVGEKQKLILIVYASALTFCRFVNLKERKMWKQFEFQKYISNFSLKKMAYCSVLVMCLIVGVLNVIADNCVLFSKPNQFKMSWNLTEDGVSFRIEAVSFQIKELIMLFVVCSFLFFFLLFFSYWKCLKMNLKLLMSNYQLISFILFIFLQLNLKFLKKFFHYHFLDSLFWWLFSFQKKKNYLSIFLRLMWKDGFQLVFIRIQCIHKVTFKLFKMNQCLFV